MFEGHQTDSIMRVQQEAMLSDPDPRIKAYLWNNLSKPESASKISLYDYNMMLRVFFQPFIHYHYELVLPYLELFFECAPTIVLKLDRMRARSFLAGVCPAIRGELSDKARLQKMLDEVTDDDHPLREHSFYLDFLKDQINYIETLVRVREASNK